MRLNKFILLFMSLVVLSSCIRDEIYPCPPLQVKIAVKDKNYFNIMAAVKHGLDTVRNENLPF